MRKKNKLFCIGFGIFLLGIFGWGDRSPAEKSLMGLMYHHQAYFPGSMVLKNRDELNLSSVQEEKINELMIEFRGYFIRHVSELKMMELELTKNVKAHDVSRRKIADLIRKIGKKKTDGAIRYSNYLLDVKEILTPEQIKILTQKKTDISAFRGRRKKKIQK